MPTQTEITRAASRRVRVLGLIAESVGSRGYPPTVRELAETCEVSTRTIRVDLGRLVEAGAIERDTGEARGIRLTPVDVDNPALAVP